MRERLTPKQRALLPKARGKTAYGLLGDVIKAIREEPRRYDQWQLLSTYQPTTTKADPLLPECGTVGCVAGWVTVLQGGRLTWRTNIWEQAQKILGLTPEQANELFDDRAAGDRDENWWEDPHYEDNSTKVTLRSFKAHATRGIRHIERFRKQYKSQLTRTKVHRKDKAS